MHLLFWPFTFKNDLKGDKESDMEEIEMKVE